MWQSSFSKLLTLRSQLVQFAKADAMWLQFRARSTTTGEIKASDSEVVLPTLVHKMGGSFARKRYFVRTTLIGEDNQHGA